MRRGRQCQEKGAETSEESASEYHFPEWEKEPEKFPPIINLRQLESGIPKRPEESEQMWPILPNLIL